MNAVDPDLRLSAQRALLGAISPQVRLVKVRRDGSCITLTAICDLAFSDATHDALTTAAAEIQSDFPECDVNERITGSAEPLPLANLLGGLGISTSGIDRFRPRSGIPSCSLTAVTGPNVIADITG